MDKKDAISYCYSHKDEYIRGFENINEGIEAFDCLIVILEEKTIKPEQLPENGMDIEIEKQP